MMEEETDDVDHSSGTSYMDVKTEVLLSAMTINDYCFLKFQEAHNKDHSLGIDPTDKTRWPERSFQIHHRGNKRSLYNFGVTNILAQKEFMNSMLAVGSFLPGYLAFFANALNSTIHHSLLK